MSILKTGPYSVDACGEYYDRPVWERDLLVRGGVYGLTDIVPRDELLARCGSLGYKLTVMLYEAGVKFSDMYDLGVLAWGVFPNDMYDDAWIHRVNGRHQWETSLPILLLTKEIRFSNFGRRNQLTFACSIMAAYGQLFQRVT